MCGKQPAYGTCVIVRARRSHFNFEMHKLSKLKFTVPAYVPNRMPR